MHTNESKGKWGILDALLVLGFIFILTNIFTWLTAGLIETLIITQKYLISTIFQTTAVLLALVYFNIIKGVTWKELGIRAEKPTRIILYGVLGGIILFGMVVTAGVIIELIFPFKPTLQPFAKLVLEAKDFSDLIVLLFMGSVLAPIGEEIYFRGMVYPVFKERWGLLAGMIISGIFFGLLHFDVLRFFPLFLGGVGLAYIYEKSNSLFSCMLAHGLWNGVMVLILYFSNA